MIKVGEGGELCLEMKNKRRNIVLIFFYFLLFLFLKHFPSWGHC